MLTSSLDTTMGKLNHLTQILYSPYDVIESLNPIQFDLMSSGYEGQSPQSPPLSRYRWVSLFKSCSEQYISDTIVTLLCAHQTPGNIYLFIWEYGISSLIFLWQCNVLIEKFCYLWSIDVLCCILIMCQLCHHLGIIVITHKLVQNENEDIK